MGTLYLEVVTPEKLLISQEVQTVVAPGSLGEFGILEGHIPFLTGIMIGGIRYVSGEKKEYIAVTSGFVEVHDNKVSILVDSAEKAIEIDIERAQQSMERARKRLEKERGTEDIDFMRAELSLARAINRIKIAGKRLK